MFTLDKAKTNTRVSVVQVSGDRAVKRRLMEFGILPGEHVFVKKVAPLGDPIELTVKNSQITLRRKDAKNITIKEI